MLIKKFKMEEEKDFHSSWSKCKIVKKNNSIKWRRENVYVESSI